MANKLLSYIFGVATQGGADAFVESQIQTGLDGQTRQCYAIREITYELVLPAVPIFPGAVAVAQDLEIALCRRTKAAMPDINDTDLIKKWHWSAYVATLAGTLGSIFETSGRWSPPVGDAEVLLVEDPVFLQLDSTATGATFSVRVAIAYEIVTISELERLNLLTRSLA